MISLFLVNGDPLENIPNPTQATVSIEGITSEAQRSDKGNLIVLNKVNSIPKLTLTWDLLKTNEAERLCSLFGIDVAEAGNEYETKTIEKLTFQVRVRLPCGLRTSTYYVGDTVSGTLLDYSGESNKHMLGGQYWSNFSIELIGVGEEWQA